MKQYVLNDVELEFKAIKNKDSKFDFLVLYPNSELFSNLNMVLSSYAFTLADLTQADGDIEKFLKILKDNPSTCVVIKEDCDFVVEKYVPKDSRGICTSERLITKSNEMICELYYTDEFRFNLIDKSNKVEKNHLCLDVMLYIDFDCYKFYFSGGYVYIEDNKNNKKYSIYLD